MFSKSVKGAYRPLVGSPRCLRRTSCMIVRSACNSHDRKRGPSCIGLLSRVVRRAFSEKKGLIVPSFTIKHARRVLCFVERVGTSKLICKRSKFGMCISDPLTGRTAAVFSRRRCSYFSRRTVRLVGGKVGPVDFPKLGISIADSSSGSVGCSRRPGMVVSTDNVYSTNHVGRRLGRGL